MRVGNPIPLNSLECHPMETPPQRTVHTAQGYPKVNFHEEAFEFRMFSACMYIQNDRFMEKKM
jgi:hypothetical protein